MRAHSFARGLVLKVETSYNLKMGKPRQLEFIMIQGGKEQSRQDQNPSFLELSPESPYQGDSHLSGEGPAWRKIFGFHGPVKFQKNEI